MDHNRISSAILVREPAADEVLGTGGIVSLATPGVYSSVGIEDS